MDHDPSHPPHAGSSSDRLIADRLSTEARRIDIGSPMVDVVISRGRQRQNRRRTAVGVMAVVGVCAGTIVGINALSQPSDRSISSVVGDGPSATTVVDDAPGVGSSSGVRVIDSDLVWARVEPGTTQALSVFSGSPGSKIAGTGPFVAWSTTPGVSNDVVPSLWRSDDGISWTQVADPPLMTASAIADRDGRFFAYGTTPPAAANSGHRFDLSLVASDDGGTTWSDISLPVDTSDLADEPGVSGVSVTPVSIAAGTGGVLAAARISATIDWEHLLPDGMWETGNWNVTADGIQIMAAPSCGSTSDTVAAVTTATAVCNPPATTIVVGATPTSTVPAGADTTVPLTTAGTMTWAELGISAKAASYISGVPQLFFSADGATFTAVAQPTDVGGGWQDVRLTDVDDGFVAAATTYDDTTGVASSTLFHTVDGSSWAAMGPSPLTYTETFASFDGRLVMSGQVQVSAFQQASVVAVQNEAGGWTTALLDDLSLPSDGVKTYMGNTAVAVGPTGITVVATQYIDAVAQAGGAEVSRSGITMRAADGNGEFSFIDDASGSTLASTVGRIPDTDLVSLDETTGDYDVRLEAGGDVVATFTADELFSRMNEIATFGPVPVPYVFHSTDGVAWSRESLNVLTGQQLTGSAGVRLTDSQIIVAATVKDEATADGTPKQIIMVGTPQG